MARILCIDDDSMALDLMRDTLEAADHDPFAAKSVGEALSVMAEGPPPDLILCDYRMPGTTGLEFLELLDRKEVDIPVITITAYATIEHAVACIKAGAVDYLTKPFKLEELEMAVEQALQMADLKKENSRLHEEVRSLKKSREIIGESPVFRKVLETLRTVAPTRASVLLQGESGTGKELLARMVHDLSDRSAGPYIQINCAALPENLVESTLFGHEKGAFTGAVKQVKGAFERAHGGTLLLDEVTEMRPDLQAKLLRVLQEQEFERVGGHKKIEVDIRLVSTSNRDLDRAVAEGVFRQDLLYRLNVVPVRVPPLRERLEDIPLLVRYFAKMASVEMGREVREVEPEVMEMLQRHYWPGNVRELKHEVERAVILSSDDVLRKEAFDRGRFGLARKTGGLATSAAPGAEGASGDSGHGADADEARIDPFYLDTLNLDEVEEVLIERALAATKNNRTKAAKLLGMSPRTLRSKLNG